MVGAEPLEAGFAGFLHRAPRRVLRIDLADEEDAIPPPGDCLAHNRLGLAIGIHFGGIDQGQAEIDAEPQRIGLLGGGAVALAQMPGTLADAGDGRTVRKCNLLHADLMA